MVNGWLISSARFENKVDRIVVDLAAGSRMKLTPATFDDSELGSLEHDIQGKRCDLIGTPGWIVRSFSLPSTPYQTIPNGTISPVFLYRVEQKDFSVTR